MEIFKLFGSIFVNTDAADKSMQKTEKNAESIATKFGNGIKTAAKWGAAIVTAAAVAGTAIMGSAVSAAENFEQAFAKVNTLLSDTTDIEKYKKEIIALSNETGIATSELCESIYSAISAGVDEAEAINFTAEALKLAEGGFTDTATAVDVMTTAINAYGLSAKDASQISDYLITTQNLGKTTVDELASSLGKVIPVASAYGVQLDDLSTNMAVMTKNGIATAEATTYTKAMINELGDSGSKVSGILLEETGKSFAQLKEEGYSLGDVMQILGESVDGDSGAFNELWASSEAGIGALALLNTGAEQYNSMLKDMRDSAGATAEAYDTMHDTLGARIETLKTNAHNMMIELGSAILPVVEEVMDLILDNMPMIQEAIGSLTPVLADVASMILPVLAELAQTLLPLIVDLINQGMPLIAQIAEMILPVLMELAQTVLPVMVDLISQVMPFISQLIETLLPIFTSLLSTLLPPLMQIVQSIMPLLVTVLNAVTPLLNLLAELLEPIIQLFAELLTPIIEIISAALQPLIEIISELIASQLRPLIEVVKLVGSIFGDVLKGILSSAKSVIDNVIGVFKGITTFLKGVFTGDFKMAFQGIIDIVSNIFGGIVNIVKFPINAIIDLINGFIGGLNKIKIPEWVPGLGGKGININPIPKLYTGGLVGAGTLISTNEHEPEIIGNYGNKTLVMNNAQIIETMIGAISATMESFIEQITGIIGKGTSTAGDIIVPVYIGNESIEEIIINAKEGIVRRSGGHVNA
jgi:TP901 family phage tail tape measure protein